MSWPPFRPFFACLASASSTSLFILFLALLSWRAFSLFTCCNKKDGADLVLLARYLKADDVPLDVYVKQLEAIIDEGVLDADTTVGDREGG